MNRQADLDEKVERLRKQLKSMNRRLLREQPAVYGLAPVTFQVLATIQRLPKPVRPGKLAEELQMASPNMATALRTLEASGNIVREKDSDDGRKAILLVTEQGRKSLVEARRSRGVWLREAIVRNLSDEEQELLFQAGNMLKRLADDKAF